MITNVIQNLAFLARQILKPDLHLGYERDEVVLFFFNFCSFFLTYLHKVGEKNSHKKNGKINTFQVAVDKVQVGFELPSACKKGI